MTWDGRFRASGLLLALMVGSAQSAHAAETSRRGPEPMADSLEGGGRGDGVYGRFDGPLAPALGVGFEVAPSDGVVRPSAHAALRFYQTAGLSVAFAQSVASTDPLERSLGICAVIEPIFLLRWSGDHEWGRPFWDLALDSISLSAGAIVAEPRGANFGDSAGFRLGLGAGFPLLSRADGPWLRLGGRLDTGLADSLLGSFWANLEWQWFWLGQGSD